MGVPRDDQNGLFINVYNGQCHLEMDDLGVPLFGKPPFVYGYGHGY